jgi:hypothetical protein
MIRRSGHSQVKHFLAVLGLIFGWREGLHGLDDEALGVFDLTEDKSNIHRGLLGLALASAVNPVLPDQGQGVGQDVESGGKPPPYRAHLKLVPLTGFLVVFQHRLFLKVVVETLSQIHECLEAEPDRAGLVVFPGLLHKERPGDIQMRPGSALGNKLLQEETGG